MAEPGANRTYDLPPASPNANEGKTVAGWTLMWGVILGAVILAVGVAAYEMWIIAVGAAVVVLALVASRVMRGMGLGQPSSAANERSTSDDWYA
jgi:hypothetical protein